MEESLELTVKSFFGVVSLSYNYTLMTGLKSDGSGIETTSSTGVELTVSEAEAFSDVTTITPSDTSCGCYPVTVTFNVENGADNFTYQPSSPFVAWPGKSTVCESEKLIKNSFNENNLLLKETIEKLKSMFPQGSSIF